MRRFFRATYYLAGTVFFLAIAVAGFTQTKTFRTYLHDRVSKFLADELHAEVELGSLEGNLATRLRVEGVTLSESGEVLFHADRLEARYEPLGLLLDRISFSEIKLSNPTVRLLRSRDGTWNVERIFPTAAPDSAGKPSAIVVNLGNVQLENAEFLVVDSLKMQRFDTLVAQGSPVAVGDYPTLALRGVKLHASARIDANGIVAEVEHLSFVSEQPAFALTRLSGEFELSKSATSVRNLSVETAESRFTADASLQEVDLAGVGGLQELKGKPVRANISVSRLSLAELRQLFPTALQALDREVAVQANVAGTVDNVHIENISVRTPRSFVSVEGTVKNLHRPALLDMDLVSVNNKLDPGELPLYLPRVNLPDMKAMGELVYNVRFVGKPSLFTLRVEGHSGAGGFVADGAIEVQNDTLLYDATVTTSGINLGALLGDKNLTSKLSSTVIVKGSGTDVQTMNATAHAVIDSSEFYGIPLGASTVTVEVARGTLVANTKLVSGKTNIDLAGSAQLQRGTISGYELNGTISSLNLAPLFKSAHYASELSFSLDAKGKGMTFEEMQTNLRLQFSPSSFGRHTFQEGKVVAELDAVNPERQRFHLESDVADIDVEGKFHLDTFIATMYQSGLLIGEAINHRLGSLSPLRGENHAGTVERQFQTSLQPVSLPVNATYSIAVKDLFPLGVFLGYQMAGSGRVSGEVSGSLECLHLKGSTGLNAFAYADSTVALSAYSAVLTYTIDDLSRTKILDAVRAQVEFASKRFDVNTTAFYTPSLSMTIQGPDGSFHFRTLADSTIGIEASGISRYSEGFITYTLDKLTVDAQSYRFANNEPVVATLGQDGLHIRNFWMRHGAEEVKAAGIFNPAGTSEVELQLINFQLRNLQLFSADKAFVRDVRALSGTVNATASITGAFDNPGFSLYLVAHDVQHGQTAFGQVQGRATYLNRNLDLFVELRNKPNEMSLPPDFVLSGFLPYDFALSKRLQRPPTGEMNLVVRSRGLRLELLDPFIGELSNLSGTMVCDVTLRGTLEQPRYEGSLSLQGAQFHFTPLGISYIMDGKLVPDGQRIALQDFRVSNIQQDRQDGVMDISGSFTLDGLILKDFDLLANGQLLVMKESARQPGQALYGSFFGGTGTNGVRWLGTPQQSFVSGKIYVKNANLTLPPARDQFMNTSRDVTVTVIDDTSHAMPGKLGSANLRNGFYGNGSALFAMNNGSDLLHSNGNTAAETDQREDGRSFLDRLVYNLDVETQGPTYVRFLFNPFTGEELFAELKGRMAFSKDGDQTRLTGEVEVGDRSYYNFLKRFQATGNLTFTGDALNPELNILATYESVYKLPDTAQTSSASSQPNEKRVIVLLEITGTRQTPKPRFDIETVESNGEHVKRTEGDVESDAIAFILTGSFRDELTQQERSSLLGPNLLYGLTSSVLSGPISDFIKKEFGFVSSVDVMYYGGDVQSSTDVRVMGEVGEAVIRFGGRVFSDIGNANASVQLPMSSVLGSEKWRNLIIEVERRVEGMESYEQRRELNGVRLIYRITF